MQNFKNFLRDGDWHWIYGLFSKLSLLAWKFAFGAFALLWIVWLTYPCIATIVSKCDEERGLAIAPAWLLPAYVLPLSVSLWMEAKVFAHMFPLQTVILGALKYNGYTVPLWIFLPALAGLSIVTHLDLATSGIFLGRMLKTSFMCSSKLDTYWTIVVSHSSITLPSLATLTMGLWFAMVVQPIIALRQGIPIKVGRGKWGACIATRELLKYNDHGMVSHKVYTLGGGKEDKQGVYGDTVLLAMTSAARMAAVEFRQSSLMDVTQGTRLKLGFGEWSWVVTIRHTAVKVLVAAVLESALLLNIQASTAGVVKAITGEVDNQVMMSISFGLLSVANNVLMGGTRIRMMVVRFRSECGPDLYKDHIRVSVGIFFAAAASSALLVMYGAIKSVMVYHCSYGAWNMGGGCVEDFNLTLLNSTVK